MQRRALVIAMMCMACGKKGDAPAGPATYTLSVRGDKQAPPGGVKVTITWPAGWSQAEKPDAMGAPRMVPPDVEGILEGATLVLRYCPDDKQGDACIDHWVKTLHEGPVEQTPVGDRRWIKTKLGKIVNGSLFVLHPATKTVVECQLFVTPEHEKFLADMRKACEGLML